MTERTNLPDLDEFDRSTEQGDQGKSYVCDRCFSTWTTLNQREHGSDLFRIEESVDELSLSTCRVCRVLAKVMQEHLKRSPTLKTPLLRWNKGDLRRSEVTFNYDNATQPETLLLSYSAGKYTWYVDGQWLPVDYWHSDARMFAQQHPGCANFPLIKRWIHICQKSHGHCKQSTQGILRDLRLIDCTSKAIVSAPTGCAFVALSYVWGASILQADVVNGFVPENLPRTIEDSIYATRLLGHQYLWVDKFCIEQDNANDKHLQIQQMGAIYETAQVTLIASAGRDPSHGLPGVRNIRKSYRYGRHKDVVDLDFLPLLHNPFIQTSAYHEVVNSAWSTRAWTFQEGYLSRRRLYFTDRAVLLVCNQTHHEDPHEMGHVGIETLRGTVIPLSVHSRYGHLHEAMQVLEQYSTRELRYDSDALSAVAGVLNYLGIGGDFDSTWGTPFSEIPIHGRFRLCIHWKHENPATRRSGYPSWSPLGWRGQVKFNSAFYQYSLQRDELSGLREDSDRMTHEQRSQELKITATILEVPSSCLSHPGYEHIRIPLREVRSGERRQIYLPFHMDQKRLDFDVDSPLMCAFTSSFPILPGDREISGLLVRKLGHAYERIGFTSYQESMAERTGESNTMFFRNIETVWELNRDSRASPHEPCVPWPLDAKSQTITLI